MRLLDTREQKSPRFLMDAFPDITTTVLESGDYFSGEQKLLDYKNSNLPFSDWGDWLVGNLVEIKIGKDFGIHTEQLERFQDELYRMSCYRQKNPHVQLHAVWMVMNKFLSDLPAYEIFVNLCSKYHVWPHFVEAPHNLIKFLKDLDQPSSYKEFEPYIKRSHEEPTILAKMFRQIDGISSENAIKVAAYYQDLRSLFWWDEGRGIIDIDARGINAVFGATKKGNWTKLNMKVKKVIMIETGEQP